MAVLILKPTSYLNAALLLDFLRSKVYAQRMCESSCANPKRCDWAHQGKF